MTHDLILVCINLLAGAINIPHWDRPHGWVNQWASGFSWTVALFLLLRVLGVI